MGLHDIVDQYKGGELMEFTATELKSMIRSLFADTPLRDRALTQIKDESR
jgi:hypothetical protein